MSLIRILSRRLALLSALVVFALAATLPLPGTAQSLGGLQQQLQLFNALPAAQQQAMMQQLMQQMSPQQKQALAQMLQAQGVAGGGEAAALQGGLGQPSAATMPTLNGQEFPGAQAGILGEVEERRNPEFVGGDTLVIKFTRNGDVAPQPGEGSPAQIEQFRQRLVDGNPYRLDDQGRLHLPGVPTIPLAGLNVFEATTRIAAEPSLRLFKIDVTQLPLKPIGTEALKPFGYDLFQRPNPLLSALAAAPVPEDYVIGPGDTVDVQLYGKDNTEYFLRVNRDGTINFPQIGPITVSGLEFSDLRALIKQRVSEQLIGVQVSTTLGALRSIRVFVVGDVEQPGSYTVSGFSTITNALFQSGGVSPIGSLRRIELLRDGKVVDHLDLYELLLHGNKQGDVRLQAGDVIFVPPIGATVSVYGQVRRPAIYEVEPGATVGDLIELAGGLNPDANRDDARLVRIAKGGGTAVEDLDLTQAASLAHGVKAGDVLRISESPDLLDDSVKLSGNVFEPGLHEWRPGMRLTDLIPRPTLVKPESDLNYVLIRRELIPNVQITVLSADLQAAWQHPGSAANVPLHARDTVYVFNLDIGRQQVVKPLLHTLAEQAPPKTPHQVASIGGAVRAPGQYPLEPGMRISDLLRAGGGMSASAYAAQAELTRYSVIQGHYRQTKIVNVDLAAIVNGDEQANLLVHPYDFLSVREVPRWQGTETVTLKGEVRFPGTYPIRRGETLTSVLKRAGGLTERAYPKGSVFTRVSLKREEQAQLKKLANRIQNRIAALSSDDASTRSEISTGKAVVQRLQEAQATGRLVIRLDALLSGDEAANVRLRDGDTLMVPMKPQEVTVLGQVQYPTSHLYRPDADRKDYVSESGGLTAQADRGRIYIVRANGAVETAHGGRWFHRDAGKNIQPGDTIVVPTRIKHVNVLNKLSSATQILYNLAIAAAAASSF